MALLSSSKRYSDLFDVGLFQSTNFQDHQQFRVGSVEPSVYNLSKLSKNTFWEAFGKLVYEFERPCCKDQTIK